MIFFTQFFNIRCFYCATNNCWWYINSYSILYFIISIILDNPLKDTLTLWYISYISKFLLIIFLFIYIKIWKQLSSVIYLWSFSYCYFSSIHYSAFWGFYIPKFLKELYYYFSIYNFYVWGWVFWLVFRMLFIWYFNMRKQWNDLKVSIKYSNGINLPISSFLLNFSSMQFLLNG